MKCKLCKIKFLTRKSVLFILVLISIIMSSGTFAYWAVNVEGTESENSFSFYVGSTTYIDYDFVLYEEFQGGSYLIDNSVLVQDRQATGEDIDVEFGINWEDIEIVNEDGTVTKARINLYYDLYVERDGHEANFIHYWIVESLLTITFDDDNSDFITLNSGTESFGYNISLDQNSYKYYYNYFNKCDIQVIVYYEIVYEVTE